jgi:NADH:ubiquinone oxidoreductase subunit E
MKPMPTAVSATGEKISLPDSIVQFIESVRSQPRRESYLIAILQMVQRHFGYLPASCLDEISQRLQVPSAKVTGVATFYHFFTFVPKGKHTISVCLGTACYVKGASTLFERLQSLLNVKPGHASPDGLFSLESARCVGACALAPVVIVDDKVYASVRPDELPKILAKYGFKPDNK